MSSTDSAQSDASPGVLTRELGVFGATMMGLGSIIGTGVFVSVGIAAGIAGPAVILAIAIAAVVAACNALSSAQLAASHPVSGGTYEYGYKYLSPPLGFIAGWMFLCAKAASAATAGLGFAGYLLYASGHGDKPWHVPVAATVVVVLTLIVLSGLRRSNAVNIVIVTITLAALLGFVVAGLPNSFANGAGNLSPFFAAPVADSSPIRSLLHATALMFVAFTGYGRIATLSEEVRDPRMTIPRAITVTLLFSALLYIAVVTVGICAAGAGQLYLATRSHAAPLEVVSRTFSIPHVHVLVAIGAMTAMLGVLLNLILGLSRVLLAMGRRGDMPTATAALNSSGSTPHVAVLVIGALILGLVLIGDVKTTWSFSAFTVLVYYAITNLAALRLPMEKRLYSPLFAWGGLGACLFLAFWVEWRIWIIGLAMILIGLLWHAVAQRLKRTSA
jgi:basic amino acid/polyamine antiporter, APA family